MASTMMMRRSCVCLVLFWSLLPIGVAVHAAGRPVAVGRAGKVPGVTSWVVPPTPDGLTPSQSWLSIGSSPDGQIYVTGSDHKTNAALFRLGRQDARLAYAGDARAASETAANWLPGETAQKFHVRPLYYHGRLYLATADFTDESAGFLNHRGFHWYAYDPAAGRFSDLCATETGGVGGEHASIVAMVIDEERGLIYGHDTPRGNLYCYNIATGRTANLGKPPCVPDGCHMPGRYLWINHAGRVYFTISACGDVLFYDPKTGFGERKEWTIAVEDHRAMVFRTGTLSLDHERVYVADAGGRIYRYDKQDDSFLLLGKAASDGADYECKGSLKMRAFNLAPDEKKIYFINDDAKVSAFWEWDIASHSTKRLCDLSALDDRIGAGKFTIHGGNDSWDDDGYLYFCSFGKDPANPTELILSRLDPVRLKVQLGLLADLVEINMSMADATTIRFRRTGGTLACQQVILGVRQAGTVEAPASFRHITFPAGSDRIDVGLQELLSGPGAEPRKMVITVLGNGDTYRAGADRIIEIAR
jgi:hypothetical protein